MAVKTVSRLVRKFAKAETHAVVEGATLFICDGNRSAGAPAPRRSVVRELKLTCRKELGRDVERNVGQIDVA